MVQRCKRLYPIWPTIQRVHMLNWAFDSDAQRERSWKMYEYIYTNIYELVCVVGHFGLHFAHGYEAYVYVYIYIYMVYNLYIEIYYMEYLIRPFTRATTSDLRQEQQKIIAWP